MIAQSPAATVPAVGGAARVVDDDAAVDLEPELHGEFDAGDHADADHDEVGRDHPAVLELDAGDRPATTGGRCVLAEDARQGARRAATSVPRRRCAAR